MNHEELLVQIEQQGRYGDQTFSTVLDFLQLNMDCAAQIEGRMWAYGSSVVRCKLVIKTDPNGVEHQCRVLSLYDPDMGLLEEDSTYYPNQTDLFSNQWVIFKLNN